MNALPVPALKDTLERMLKWMAPLCDNCQVQRSKQAATAFAEGDGMALQAALQAYAAECSPDSWLIQRWRQNNLRNRDSLMLSTNVAMAIDWHATQTGIKRLVHFISAQVQVHADYRQGRIAPVVTPRGDELCMNQYRILAGASRRPAREVDDYVFADDGQGTQARHIVVLYRGYAWRVDVIDEQGAIASPAQLDAALHDILESHDRPAEIAFTSPSMLTAEMAAEVRAQLISRDENSRIWQQVERALFVVTLDCTHEQDMETALNDVIFGDGSGVWAYKPLHYYCFIGDDRYFAVFEHTWNDAGVIKEIVALAQKHHDEGNISRRNALPPKLNITPLNWHIEERTRALLKEGLSEYARRAESLRVRQSEHLLTEDDQALLSPYSADAVCQLLLQYAQYSVFSGFQSVYEAVDMRHYVNGRTECLRPVSPESVALVQALAEDNATVAMVDAMNLEHKQRVKDCKRGHGVHRHLLGLKMMAEAQGMDELFFDDAGLQALSSDFFSTTSLGSHDTIAQIVFAPTHPQGFGVNYAANRNHLNFVLMFRHAQNQQAFAIHQAIGNGLRRLLTLLRAA